MNSKSGLGYYLLLSLLAGLFLVLLAIADSSSPPPVSLFDKQGITLLFISCCLVGISFAFRPNWRKQWLKKKGHILKNKPHTLSRKFQGHHPTCDKFHDHTISFLGETATRWPPRGGSDCVQLRRAAGSVPTARCRSRSCARRSTTARLCGFAGSIA